MWHAAAFRSLGFAKQTALVATGHSIDAAGVVVVDLAQGGLDAAEAQAEIARRLWGNPRYAGIARVIIVEGQQVTADLTRPATFALGESAATAGAAGRTATHAGGAR